MSDFEITSIEHFKKLDLDKNGSISKKESSKAVETYDTDDQGESVELWEYMQKTNEQNKKEIFTSFEIERYKGAYEHIDEFKSLFNKEKIKYDSYSMLELLKISAEFPDKHDEAYDLLKQLVQKGIAKQLGIENLIKLIDSSYMRLMLYWMPLVLNNVDRKLIVKYDAAALMLFFEMFRGYPPFFHCINDINNCLEEENKEKQELIERIGMANLLELAKYGCDEQVFRFIIGYNIDRVMGISNMMKIARSVEGDTDKVFLELVDMGKGLIAKFGPENLVEIAEISSFGTRDAYSSIRELNEKGLIEKIGVPCLMQIARELLSKDPRSLFARPALSNIYDAIIKLEENGVLDKIDPQTLVEIARANSAVVAPTISLLLDFEKAGLIDKIGKANLLKIVVLAKKDTYNTFCRILALQEKGLIDKMGIDKLMGYVKSKKLFTEKGYESILKEYSK